MTKEQIDSVLDRVRTWPLPRQEDAIRVLLTMEAQETSPYSLSDEERADIDAALAEIDAGDVATDDEVATLFRRLR
jgi:hypothetical protein